MTKNNFIVLTFTIKLLSMKQLINCRLCFINYCRTNRKMLNTGKYLPEFKFVLPFVSCQLANWADYNISNYISLNTIVFGQFKTGRNCFQLFVVIQPPLRILTPFVLDNLTKLVLSLQRFSDLWYFHVKSKHCKNVLFY